jgi:hypothetical protein
MKNKELAQELLRTGHSQRFSTLQESIEFGESGGLSKVNAWMGAMMHTSERLKREITVKAQYDAELAVREKKGESITSAVRKSVAEEAVRDSLMLNGGSSSLTKPGFTQGEKASIIGMYKQYATLQYYLQYRILNSMFFDQSSDVRKAAGLQWLMISATSAALAGARGIPLMGVVFGFYNMFAGPDEDDAETVMRKALGAELTEGLFASALNMNIGPRIEYTSMLIRETELPDTGSVYDKAVVMFGGPTFGSINRIVRGVDLIQDGHLERGVESLMPVAMANVFKSLRFGREGALTLRGDPVVDDMSPSALISQFMGFAPADFARATEFTTRQKRYENTVNTRRNRLYDRVYMAYRTNDVAGYVEALRDIAEFNSKYPERAIDGSALQQSVRTRDRNTEKMRMGRLPGTGFEGRWESEADDWGF